MCTVVSPHPSPGLTPEQFIVGPWSRTSVFIALLTEILLPVACFPAYVLSQIFFKPTNHGKNNIANEYGKNKDLTAIRMFVDDQFESVAMINVSSRQEKPSDNFPRFPTFSSEN